MISVVLVCFNEATKLEKSLESVVGFATEIVVVDLKSSDDTKMICKKYGAKVYEHVAVPYVELLRNYSVSKGTGDWIMVLDPDEILGDNLKDRLKQIALENKFTAVNIPRKNIFFGRWITHSNWWPDRHVRFFKKGHVRWGEKIHKYPKVSGSILNLEAREDLAIIHHSYQTIAEFIDRQNRYSTIEAKNLHDSGMKFSWICFFWRPVREFLVRFVRHLGFLDRFYGFVLVYLMMVYQLQVMIKLREMEEQRK